jgi:RNA polymerase sigma-70 factor (ECF subfamily)
MEDEFLISQVLKGNKNAYKLLVIRYQRPLFSFFKKFGFRAQRIEELSQDTFLKSFEHLASFQIERGTFSSWFFSIARNLALNELKKKDEIFFVEEKDLEQLAANIANENIDNVLMRKCEDKLVQNLVGKIPNPFKVPVILSYVDELSLAEIASIENCSIGTVKSRIHRGKLTLRMLLLKEELI